MEILFKELSKRIEVFSLQEWDVEYARGTTHKIYFKNSRTFWKRSQIFLSETEDLRNYPNELLTSVVSLSLVIYKWTISELLKGEKTLLTWRKAGKV